MHWIRHIAAVALLGLITTVHAHEQGHPSLHDTVAAARARLISAIEPDRLVRMSADQVLQRLTSEEWEALSRTGARFTVNIPVEIFIIVPKDRQAPFWLTEQDYERRDDVLLETSQGDYEAKVWSRRALAGEVQLGVNALSPVSDQYLVSIRAIDPNTPLVITELYPALLRVASWEVGESVYADQEVKLKVVPASFRGQRLVQTLYDRRNDGAVVGLYRITSHPSQDHADQVILTWSADPQTTQTIQWRTSTNVWLGFVAYQEKALVNQFNPAAPMEVAATKSVLRDPHLINDPTCHRFTATLEGLEPGTTYVYSVGDGRPNGWTERAEFTTAPAEVAPFSFVYMGDAQNGLDRWGTLVRGAFRERPDAAFYVMAGDLVNRGNDRDDWDSFFHNARPVYDRRQLVPSIGNHENQGGHPTLYLENFHLPTNGAPGLEAERSYWFEYSNALFVILDSNLSPATQAEWLDQVLGTSKATWKFVVYHHPAYSSAPDRDNKAIRQHWLPIFDKHHVDLALQGHDHAYLRTYPMKSNQRVDSPKDGTVYVVSVSGTKMYDQAERDYTEVGFTKVATYQVLDIQLSGDRLLYRAYDIDGGLRDELEIRK